MMRGCRLVLASARLESVLTRVLQALANLEACKSNGGAARGRVSASIIMGQPSDCRAPSPERAAATGLAERAAML